MPELTSHEIPRNEKIVSESISQNKLSTTRKEPEIKKLDFMDECFTDDVDSSRGDHAAYSHASEQPLTAIGNQPSMLKLTEFSKRHIEKVVNDQIVKNKLNSKKWQRMLTGFVMKAVEQVQPSSRMLGDIMDINHFIKVKIIDWKDSSKSNYVNGVVMSKSIASKRMQSSRIKPRILLLKDIAHD